MLTLASYSGLCHLQYFITLSLSLCKCGGRRPRRACQIWQCQCDAMSGIHTGAMKKLEGLSLEVGMQCLFSVDSGVISA